MGQFSLTCVFKCISLHRLSDWLFFPCLCDSFSLYRGLCFCMIVFCFCFVFFFFAHSIFFIFCLIMPLRTGLPCPWSIHLHESGLQLHLAPNHATACLPAKELGEDRRRCRGICKLSADNNASKICRGVSTNEIFFFLIRIGTQWERIYSSKWGLQYLHIASFHFTALLPLTSSRDSSETHDWKKKSTKGIESTSKRSKEDWDKEK